MAGTRKKLLRDIAALMTIAVLVGVTACGGPKKPSPTRDQVTVDYDILLTLPTQPVSYQKQIRPILERRCVVCHGCYDAPCQLKLS